MALNFTSNADLTAAHTFGITVQAHTLVSVSNVAELAECFNAEPWQGLPKLLLGEGSNVLFTEHFAGVVIQNRLLGREIRETAEHYHLHLGAGENWHALVQWTLEQGMFGLENLALIPGTVGAAPIQNIGAYGVELADVCEYVDYWHKHTQQVMRLTAAECQFGYRDSIFKTSLKDQAVVIAVGLKLAKVWQPKLGYGPLAQAGEQNSAHAVFDTVCAVRRSKLPDPNVLGNAGSFFKNPMISLSQFTQLQAQYPDLPSYPAGEQQVKIPAGWLIDRAELKGFQVGGAAVHTEQALVLVNVQQAQPEDVIGLARHVVATVAAQYGITLEPEVWIFDAMGKAGW